MVKSNIRIFTHGQRLGTGKSVPHYAGETIHYIGAHFDLDESWEGYDSVRAVWWNGAVEKATVFDATMTCTIPLEVVAKKGDVMVNLIASVSENGVLTDRFTSYPLKVAVIDAHARLTGSETVPVTPSQFEQFVENVKDEADRAKSEADRAEVIADGVVERAKVEADRAEQGATASAASASASAQSASESASSATASEQSASQASGYAQDASESAQSAENYAQDAEDARDEIRAMRAEAITLPAGSEATASYADGLLSLGIPRGSKGDTGDKGETGATPNITIGTVETLEPTEDATATITGTAENPVLNLGIPQGDTGEVTQAEFDVLSADVTDLKSALIPFPTSPNSKYGNQGQLLRTLANGKTEWSSVGLPTDEQTGQAVNKWLNDHPEATTTVQDGSLTYKKLVTGTLGFVSPKMYGGIGDGSADDTSAVSQAVSSGLIVNLYGLTYRITQSLNLNGVTIYNGTLKLIGSARITGSNINFYNVAFDFTEKTEASQIGIQFTGGTNTVRDCYFSNMTARLFAYQIDASNCDIRVDSCEFGVIRILEINGTQGDNTGSARHIVANTCDVMVENCVFNGFYGEDDNFFEDSDCIHVTRCEHAMISKNLFKGNWKSAVKNQYANVAVIGNTFLPTKAWYVIRLQTEAKNALIIDNIIDGACDVCFYLTSGNNIVCNNHIELSTNQLVDVANAEVIFNDNYVKIESNGGLHRTYNDSELSAFMTLSGTSVKIESNSDITCDNHFPYIFARETTQSSVKLTGKIISTGNTSNGVLYDLTGEIRTDRVITVVNSSDLVVHAYNTTASFVNCENIKYYTDKQSIASTINKCTNLHAIVNFIGTTYFADITNSQNIVIELFGTSINANVVAVNDAETTGIAINYINNRQSIYNRNSVTLAYVAKSMLV